jgi:hypothetical protein
VPGGRDVLSRSSGVFDTEDEMGKNYDTDAERITIDVWRCKTCGRVYAMANGFSEAESERYARRCCSENTPCHICGVNRTRYPNCACDDCLHKAEVERWEKCEVQPLEFPLTVQDDDVWFFDEEELLEYCENNDVAPDDLLLRIAERMTPSLFYPADYWVDYLHEDDDSCDDPECRELADKLNEWAHKNIRTYEMGPYRPDVSEMSRSDS